jgi:hypothetical protein
MPHHSPKSMDPVFVNSKRETFWILVTWAAFAMWVVGISAWLGYGAAQDTPTEIILGFPKWVFWGIAVPWLGANIVIIGFASKFMKDDALEDPSQSNSEEQD